MTYWKLLGNLLFAGAAIAPGLAAADYPDDKPIRFIVPYAAGGTADILARTYAEALKAQTGQIVIIENKPGATGAIGTDVAAKAPGDGYTIVLNSSAIVINPWLGKQPFDFAKDLVPVAATGVTPYLITINGDLPIKNVEEFVAYAKNRQGRTGCATYGSGSPPHIALELLKREAGIEVLHVPYKTSSAAVPELLSGQLDCIVEPPPGSSQLAKTGRLRVIAHTGEGPVNAYPGVDAVGKHYPGASVVGWQAIFTPASTPKPILDRMRADWAKVLQRPEVVKRIRDTGFDVASGSVDAFEKAVTSDYEKFGRAIKGAGIKRE